MPGTKQRGKMTDSTGYEIIADLVRSNFDLVMSSRVRAYEDTNIAKSVISHVLFGHTHSWRHLKTLTRWYRQQYPGFGEWQAVLEFFARKFPQETEWSEAAARTAPPPLEITKIG